VRVLLEKNGVRFGGPFTFASPSGLPHTGDSWNDEHVVTGGRRGSDDEEFYEVILTIEEKA
jgi:hypothetical protein